MIRDRNKTQAKNLCRNITCEKSPFEKYCEKEFLNKKNKDRAANRRNKPAYPISHFDLNSNKSQSKTENAQVSSTDREGSKTEYLNPATESYNHREYQKYDSDDKIVPIRNYSSSPEEDSTTNFDEDIVMQTCFSCERVLWLVLILGLITMASIQIRQRLKSYLDHDTIVQITDHHETDIDFPAITLCNFNRIYFKCLE